MRRALLLWLVGCTTTTPPVEYPDAWVVVDGPGASADPSVRLIAASEAPVVDRSSWDEAIETARRSYRDLDFEGSLASVAEAIERLTPEARDESDIDRLHQLHLLSAMNELALGRADAARVAIGDALALRPETQLDEGRFPPDVRALHEEIRATLGARGEIEVDTVPEGARLLLDGRFVGNGPLGVEASRGHHHLRCESLGFAERRLRAEWSDVTRRIRIELDALHGDALIEQLAQASGADLRSLPPAALAALGVNLDQRVLVRVEEQDEGWVAVVVDPSGATTRDLSLTARSRDAAVAEVLAQIRPEPERQVDPTRRRRILGGVIAAVFVAAAAVTLGLLLRPEPDPVLVWPRAEAE